MSSNQEEEEKKARHAEYQRKWREKNPEKARAIREKYEKKRRSSPELQKKKREFERKRRKSELKKPLYSKQKRKRYKATKDAINGFRRWTDAEIELAFSTTLTDREICEELGRSIAAVEQARIRYQERAPSGWKQKGTRRIDD